jgi:hypothetical protein
MRSRVAAPGRTRRQRDGVLARIRANADVGIAGLALFLGGFILAPCLHSFDHRADHVHGPDGGWTAIGEHAHRQAPGGVARQALAWPTPAAAAQVESNDEGLPSPHGHGALAHFGVAVTASPVFALPPAWVSIDELTAAERPEQPRRRPAVERARPRGPPQA